MSEMMISSICYGLGAGVGILIGAAILFLLWYAFLVLSNIQ